MTRTLAGLVLPAPLRTPLLKSGNVWVKAEACQRTASAKYRLVYARVSEGLRSGEISDRTTLAEVTSGSTGVALATAGAMLGLPVELHAYRTIASAKRRAIEEARATLVLHDPEVPVSQLLSAVRAKAARGSYWHLDQYARDSTARAYADLGREIVAQLEECAAPLPDAFVCPVGSGGLLQGVGAFLRARVPGIRLVAVEPEPGASIEGTRNTQLCHMGVADPYDPTFPSEVVRVPRPRSRATLGAIELGESASAALGVAVAGCRGSAVVMAPD